jgi:branched-chain amino acid transport system permease protein
MQSLLLIAQNILIGLVDGSMYVTVALGITLLFGVSRIINLAHGELFAVGGYAAYTASVVLGLNPVIGLLAALILGFPIGWLLDRVLVAPVRRRPDVEMPLEFFLILTLGLSMFLQNTMLAAFTDNYHRTPPVIKGSFAPFGRLLPISIERVLVFAIGMGIVGLLFLFLNRTTTGIAIRAASQDRAAARTVGIDVDRLDSLVFGLAAALAAAAGGIAAPLLLVYPSVGQEWTVKGLIVVIMGGLGNPVGTLWAGLGLGVLESLAVVVMPAQFKTVVGLLLMIIVLVFRPTGLLGKRLRLDA